MMSFAQEILGPRGMPEEGSIDAIDHGRWLHGYFDARGNTVAGGTSEVQRNIIGERVLGLPKG